jgi:hypothetical protein
MTSRGLPFTSPETVNEAPLARMEASGLQRAYNQLYDHQPADWRQRRSVFGPHARDIQRRRGWLVLVAAPTRSFWPDGLPIGPFASSYSAFRHAMNTPFVTTRFSRSVDSSENPIDQVVSVKDHARHFWNLSGTFLEASALAQMG